MLFSDNHDESRAIARFGERGALAASALAFMLDGVPLLYNGMEVGDTTESGAPALFERLPIFWSNVERRPKFPLFYRQIISLRRITRRCVAGRPSASQFGRTERGELLATRPQRRVARCNQLVEQNRLRASWTYLSVHFPKSDARFGLYRSLLLLACADDRVDGVRVFGRTLK